MTRGYTCRPRTMIMSTNAMTSAINEALRSSRLATAVLLDSARHGGDGVEAEAEVDEVHGLDEADHDAEERHQAALRLRPAGQAPDGGASAHTLTHPRAHGRTAPPQPRAQ